jgi:hypothetical protein
LLTEPLKEELIEVAPDGSATTIALVAAHEGQASRGAAGRAAYRAAGDALAV